MPSGIVLCAGFGTRLRPLTDELPKPLVPVGDRSILEHALSLLSAAGITELSINVYHLAEQFAAVLARAAPNVHLVAESEIRGTAGGVAGARAHLSNAPVLVWNGDILVAPPIDQLLVRCEPDSFCFGVAPRPLGEGTVGLDAEGNVVRLRGERFGTEHRSGDYVGVLALGADALAALPERGCLFGDAALPLLRAGGRVRSVAVTAPWTDAGDPPSLLNANLDWLAARQLDFFVAPGAQLASGVELRQAVVGAGARVEGRGLLERCVVCPGATAVAPLRDAIVAPSGRVMDALRDTRDNQRAATHD
ncbi:MAG TPA: nucleotidyltransferase family protein [Polyangiaceae bacterium]|nr:nucleotidyltransferase family protein [Polyangiaceae bacterium]